MRRPLSIMHAALDETTRVRIPIRRLFRGSKRTVQLRPPVLPPALDLVCNQFRYATDRLCTSSLDMPGLFVRNCLVNCSSVGGLDPVAEPPADAA